MEHYIIPQRLEFIGNHSPVASPVKWQHNFSAEKRRKGYVLRQAKVLSDTEIKRLLTVIGGGHHAARNRAAVMLSHYAGLRVGEIASLRWSDLLDQRGELKQQFYLVAENTKSGEARAVHVSRKLAKELTALKSCIMQLRPNAPVIESQKGGAFSANSLCQLLCRLYDGAGIEGATSHSGRRWFITNLAHQGISPKVIMALAGHKSLSTTQRYIDVNDQMMSSAVERLK